MWHVEAGTAFVVWAEAERTLEKNNDQFLQPGSFRCDKEEAKAIYKASKVRKILELLSCQLRSGGRGCPSF